MLFEKKCIYDDLCTDSWLRKLTLDVGHKFSFQKTPIKAMFLFRTFTSYPLEAFVLGTLSYRLFPDLWVLDRYKILPGKREENYIWMCGVGYKPLPLCEGILKPKKAGWVRSSTRAGTVHLSRCAASRDLYCTHLLCLSFSYAEQDWYSGSGVLYLGPKPCWIIITNSLHFLPHQECCNIQW